MPRSLTSLMANALSAANVNLLVFVEMDFASGFLRATNAGYNFDWNGQTWVGLGAVGKISAVAESAHTEAHGVSLTISGVNPAHISIALGEQYQGRSIKLWLATLDENYAINSDPVLTFIGRMDTMDIELGETATITVNAESRLADWDRARIRRWNNADQQFEFPGDKGFEFCEQMVEKQIIW